MSLERRRTVEIELDERVLDEAREAGLDLSSVAEEAVRRTLASRRNSDADRWRVDNRAAIESLNRYAEENGLPFDRYRRYPWPNTTSI